MILDDLKAHLIAKSLIGSGENVYFNFAQSDNNCVILWEYGGFPAVFGRYDQTKTVQVTVKNTSMQTAQAKSHAIYNELATGLDYKEINGRKTSIEGNQPPFFLEKDEQNRYSYVFNITITSNRDE